MAKKVEVLLMKPLAGRGNAGEFIHVAPSFACNVLIPQGIAKIADKQLHNQRDAHMKKIEKEKAARQAKVKDLFAQLADSGLQFEKQATEADALYDSIDAKTLSVHLSQEHGILLEPKYISLPAKIEALGEYTATLTYEDLAQDVVIRVVREEKK